jgi:hypothetical protein
LPDSMPTALPAPPVWWCKHAAYGIGLTLRHVTPGWDLQANFWLPYANLLKKGLIGKVLAEHRRIWFASANLFILMGRLARGTVYGEAESPHQVHRDKGK